MGLQPAVILPRGGQHRLLPREGLQTVATLPEPEVQAELCKGPQATRLASARPALRGRAVATIHSAVFPFHAGAGGAAAVPAPTSAIRAVRGVLPPRGAGTARMPLLELQGQLLDAAQAAACPPQPRGAARVAAALGTTATLGGAAAPSAAGRLEATCGVGEVNTRCFHAMALPRSGVD